jgi:formate dehydrogenase subunit delta
MMSNDERLAYMAEQIYRNFAAQGRDIAVASTVDHLVSFWDPRMKARAFAMLDDPAMHLSDDARTIFQKLRGAAGAG